MTPNPRQLAKPFLRGWTPLEDDDRPNTYEREARPTGYTNDMLAALDMAARHRAFDCVQYDDCLTRAANLMWRNFSCLRCSLRHAVQAPSATEHAWRRMFEDGARSPPIRVRGWFRHKQA